MACRYKLGLFVLIVLAVLCFPQVLKAITAEEIMDDAARRSFGDSFRAVVSAGTEKAGKLMCERVFWVMGKMDKNQKSFFVDFQEPQQSRGLRYLVLIPADKDSSAFMYMPSVQQTLPLEGDSASFELGGTGLTMADLNVFLRRKGDKVSIVGEEKVGSRDCYVVRASSTASREQRVLWITKNDLVFVKSETLGLNGDARRTCTVTEFFRTQEGHELPRKEVLTVPAEAERIVVTQEHVIFGVMTPDELWDPATFGTFRWRE